MTDQRRSHGAQQAGSVAAGASGDTADRRTVLLAAVALIDQHDLRYVTLPRLGAHLGVEGSALYRHVHSRDDLLDGIVELLIDEYCGDLAVPTTTNNWQGYLQGLAHGVRQIALAHPRIFPLIATAPPAAPWLRPALRSVRWTESFLSTMHDFGFTDRASIAAYRAFTSFLLGHLLLDVFAEGTDIGRVHPAGPSNTGMTDTSRYPRLKRLEAELSQDHSAEEFEIALEALLDRLELLMPAPHHWTDARPMAGVTA
jgi:AcrR family transcriptional regulator